MIPATEAELQLLKKEFLRLRGLGNSELKAAYLAAANQGFTEIVDGNGTGQHIKLMRDSDHKFIICSVKRREVVKPVPVESIRDVSFHVDEKQLNGGK